MPNLIVFLLFFTLNSMASDKAIYGVDSRLDISDSKNNLYKLKAKSVAAFIPDAALFPRGNTSLLSVLSLEDMGQCSQERFSHQQAISICTGFLIGKNRLITAGHCIDEGECRNHKWVFDYQLESGEQNFVGQVPNSKIYSCKKVVAWKNTSIFKQDWAVIELDRPVTDRPVLTISPKLPRPGDSLFTIGTPSGLPLKVATGKVRRLHVAFFNTNLDTYAGNSGSPVFNSKTGLVEGILVRGGKDYRKTARGCQMSNVYPENGGLGESVTFIDVVKGK